MRNLFLIILVFPTLVSFGEYSFEEKIDLLYEATPDKSDEAIILKRELRDFIETLHAFDKKSHAKQIKKIHALTKKKYLFSYKLKAFFADLISSNTYNCVTGTALYAIIFDELDIPYVIHELPQHVYLVAYPETDNISVESTTEKDGVYYWTDLNKEEIINWLYNTEQVSKSEINIKGIDGVIEEHFYNNEVLDFGGLAGMHFFNRALYMNDKERYEEALYFVNRAQELNESEFNLALKGTILGNLILDTDLEEISTIYYLISFYELIETKAHKQRIEGNFAYVVQEALFTRHDEEFIDSTLSLVESELTEIEDQNMLTSLVYEVKSRWHYNRHQYNKSFEYATSGYDLNPENKEFEDMIASLVMIIALQDEPETDIEMEERISGYEEQYPFILSSPPYINFSVVLYAMLVTEAYLDNEIELGQKYLVKMETNMESDDIDESDTYEYIGEAYGSIASYYFRNRSYEVALKWINKALEYDPESDSLLRKKRFIEEKM